MTLRVVFGSIKARSRAAHEQAILTAWYVTKIKKDAARGDIRLSDYSAGLEEISPDEEFERSADEMFARLDRQIARQEARTQ